MRQERTFSLAEAWGRQVARRREELGLTQKQLADLCDITQQTVSKIENGAITPLDSLKQSLARALATEPWELFPWPGQKRQKAEVA